MRAKAIYLAIILLAAALCSCVARRTTQKNDYREYAELEYKGRTSIVSLDSLQRWLSGRLLVTEVHLFQPDSTGAQAVEKVVRKELTFAGGEEQSQEVKGETVVQVDEREDVEIDVSKQSTRNKSPLFALAAFAVCVAMIIFVQLKQLNTK